jgi:hypothetical protein
MSDPHFTFTVEDADGDLHDYRVKKPHDPIANGPGISGLRLVRGVIRAAGGPISKVLNSNVGALVKFVIEQGSQGKAMSPDEILSAVGGDDDETLSDLDLDLPGAFEAFCDALDQLDADDLLPKIFVHTTRDGSKLSDQAVFNSAYRANYFEMARAAFKVCRYNGFFGSLGTQAPSSGDTETGESTAAA